MLPTQSGEEPVIERMSLGTYLDDDVKLMLAWTHPRSELEVGMSVPNDVDDAGGWGAAGRVSDIHNYLKLLDSKKREVRVRS
jgi:hypothetical protein